uniref:Uncharacterized protein n=1 Tax=Oryza glumipatula TaxID=40148 RepID=A0A0E0BSM9_9ORYZ
MAVVVGVRDAPVAWLCGIWQKAAMVALQGNKSWFGLAGGGATVRLRCVLAEFVRVMEPGGGSGSKKIRKKNYRSSMGTWKAKPEEEIWLTGERREVYLYFHGATGGCSGNGGGGGCSGQTASA